MGGFVVLSCNLHNGGQCVAELTGAQGYSLGQCHPGRPWHVVDVAWLHLSVTWLWSTWPG
jgi:hypothetical protein